MKILLAEDTADLNKVICAVLRHEGYDVDPAFDGEEAMERVNTEGYGTASLLLGAGRNTMADKIDFSAGIKLVKKTGDKVSKGDTIAVLYTSDESRFEAAKKRLAEATIVGKDKPADEPLILDIVE